MSISANFPNLKPSFLADFSNSQVLDSRITFSRSTTAPYYDGKTSVLAEQNLLLQSNTFSNAAWVATSATIASGVTDPAGGTTAFSMTATAGNATLYQTLTLTATAYTESIWIQRVTGTGTINLTLDGSTLSPVTITGSWAKYTYTATPSAGSKTIGIQIVTSGDAINIYGSQLENRSSATATNITTTTALTNYIPQLLTAPINAPRFDFNPTTGESLGLLIEQSSTNLLTYSQLFSDATWLKFRTSITQTANIAPDGTQTAQLLVEDATNNTHGCANYGSQTVTSGQQYTFSAEVKAWTRNYVTLFADVGSALLGNAGVQFSLIDGTVQKNTNGYVTTSTNLGNGWWRFSYTATATASGNAKSGIYIGSIPATSAANGIDTYTGNGYSGIYIWGAQLEALAFPTSYVATTSAQVTRASDNASMTGTNFSSWYNQGQGTWYINATTIWNNSVPANIPATGWIWVGVASGNFTAPVYTNSATNSIYTYDGVTASGVTNPPFGSKMQVSTSYGSLGKNLLVNGGSASNSTYGNGFGNETILYIGANNGGNSQINARISKLAFYSQQLTVAQQQALTGT